MIYLGQMFGANTQAFLGLAGVGDLVATCSSTLSRNFTVGERLGKGDKLEDIIDSLEETAEGINTIKTLRVIQTCEPDHRIKLTSRRGFSMTEALKASSLWICPDKKKGGYLFVFHDLRLAAFIYFTGRADQATSLFGPCQTDIHGDLEGHLRDQTDFPVVFETENA